MHGRKFVERERAASCASANSHTHVLESCVNLNLLGALRACGCDEGVCDGRIGAVTTVSVDSSESSDPPVPSDLLQARQPSWSRRVLLRKAGAPNETK